MEEKYLVNKYPEGLELLAEKMDLPFPKEDIEKRKAYVYGLIDGIVKL